MSTLMPVDANDLPLPVLRLRAGSAHHIAVTATSVRNTTAFNTDTRVLSLYATTPMYVRFGINTAVATSADHFIPADTLMDFSIAGDDKQTFTHIAAIRVTSDGTLHISEKY